MQEEDGVEEDGGEEVGGCEVGGHGVESVVGGRLVGSSKW